MKESMNLQLFAEEAETENQTETQVEETNDTQPEEKKEAPKYTDADLDRIISRKMAELTKKAQKETAKKAEAERLKNMTAQEKKDHELEQLKAELAQMKRDSALSEMGKQARSILAEKSIHVSDALISNLISEDADSTKEAVESFAEEFSKAVESAVAERLKGQAPKKNGQQKSITKEDIMKIKNARERQRLIQENIGLFRK